MKTHSYASKVRMSRQSKDKVESQISINSNSGVLVSSFLIGDNFLLASRNLRNREAAAGADWSEASRGSGGLDYRIGK